MTDFSPERLATKLEETVADLRKIGWRKDAALATLAIEALRARASQGEQAK